MFNDDVISIPLPITTADSGPSSLNSTNSSSNNSLSFIDDESTIQSNDAIMLKEIFSYSVSDVCKSERFKNLMIRLREFSSHFLLSQDCPDVSHIDNDSCVEFFRKYVIFLTNYRQKLLINISQRQYLNFIRFSYSIWNFSDKLESFCVRMVSFDVHLILIQLLNKLHVTSNMLKSKPIYTLLLSIVGILHNINNKLQFTRSSYRDGNLIEVLMPFAALETSEDLIGLKTAALFLLACLVNESENSSLNANDNHIIYILDILKQTLSSPGHYSEYYGYHCLEVLQRLRFIASPDQNKRSLIDNGVLMSIEEILEAGEDGCYQDEVVASLELLWSLSFSKDCLQALAADTNNLKARIEVLSKSDNKSIVLSSRSILWNIKSHHTVNISTMIREDHITPNAVGHVMISYNHRYQEIMVKIKNSLIGSGYTVWMDVDHMSGSIADAMAEGIERASVLILGLCQAFKDSPHCRQEVKYAYMLGIPFVPVLLERGFVPDGWLGLICATLIYTEFFDLSKYNASILYLQRQLGSFGRVCDNSVISEYLLNSTNHSANNTTGQSTDEDQPQYGVITTSHCTNNSNGVSIINQSDCSIPSNNDPIIESDSSHFIDSYACNNNKILRLHTCRCKVIDWTRIDCQTWLLSNGIDAEKYGCPLMDLDGPLLFELANIRLQAPQAYFGAVKEELKLNFIDILRLSGALRRLDHENVS